MTEANYDIFRGEDGQWYWHVQAANGEIVASSEGYGSKADAEEGVKAAERAFADVNEPPESV